MLLVSCYHETTMLEKLKTAKQKTHIQLGLPLFALLLIISIGFAQSANPLTPERYNQVIEYETTSEQERIEYWLIQNNLNQYGDPKGTTYTHGSPLILDGGNDIPLIRYLFSQHPSAPWNELIKL